MISVECQEAAHDLFSYFEYDPKTGNKRRGFDTTCGFEQQGTFVYFRWCDEAEWVMPTTADKFSELVELGVFRKNDYDRMVFRNDWKTKFRLAVLNYLCFAVRRIRSTINQLGNFFLHLAL